MTNQNFWRGRKNSSGQVFSEWQQDLRLLWSCRDSLQLTKHHPHHSWVHKGSQVGSRLVSSIIKDSYRILIYFPLSSDRNRSCSHNTDRVGFKAIFGHG